MSRLVDLSRYCRDLAQGLVLDRLHPARRVEALRATTTVRQMRFRHRARLPRLSLAAVLERLGLSSVEANVRLPAKVTTGDVGDATYYHALAAITLATQPRRVLEFGTYLGVGTLVIGLNAPNAEIVTLDLPEDAAVSSDHGLTSTDVLHVSSVRGKVGIAFRDHPIAARVTQARADSLTWRARDVVEDVDLVLVDGGHSRPLISADTANAFDVISNRGSILWDDYFHLYPDVVDFLDDLGHQRPLFAIGGTNLVIWSSAL